MYAPESEEYAFPREFFPREFRGHDVIILTNNAHVTVDERLAVHINLACRSCKSESVVRWRFSDSYTEYTWAANMSKLLALYALPEQCDGTKTKVQIP